MMKRKNRKTNQRRAHNTGADIPLARELVKESVGNIKSAVSNLPEDRTLLERIQHEEAKKAKPRKSVMAL